jgi:hypothetical protein
MVAIIRTEALRARTRSFAVREKLVAVSFRALWTEPVPLWLEEETPRFSEDDFADLDSSDERKHVAFFVLCHPVIATKRTLGGQAQSLCRKEWFGADEPLFLRALCCSLCLMPMSVQAQRECSWFWFQSPWLSIHMLRARSHELWTRVPSLRGTPQSVCCTIHWFRNVFQSACFTTWKKSIKPQGTARTPDMDFGVFQRHCPMLGPVWSLVQTVRDTKRADSGTVETDGATRRELTNTLQSDW